MTASDEDAEAGSSELSAKDLKKLRSKQRRAEKKAQESKKGEIPQARKCLYLPLCSFFCCLLPFIRNIQRAGM